MYVKAINKNKKLAIESSYIKLLRPLSHQGFKMLESVSSLPK